MTNQCASFSLTVRFAFLRNPCLPLCSILFCLLLYYIFASSFLPFSILPCFSYPPPVCSILTFYLFFLLHLFPNILFYSAPLYDYCAISQPNIAWPPIFMTPLVVWENAYGEVVLFKHKYKFVMRKHISPKNNELGNNIYIFSVLCLAALYLKCIVVVAISTLIDVGAVYNRISRKGMGLHSNQGNHWPTTLKLFIVKCLLASSG